MVFMFFINMKLEVCFVKVIILLYVCNCLTDQIVFVCSQKSEKNSEILLIVSCEKGTYQLRVLFLLFREGEC